MSVVPIRSESQHEAGGTVAGVATAQVSQIKDPDGLGRVKLKLPWRDANFETDWCRIASPMAGKERGVFFLPEVGDEVLVAFERDDIRHPYVLGQLWSRPDKPPKNDAGGKNDLRVIVSRKGHKIILDDGTKGRVRIELSDGKSIQLDDDGITISDNANSMTMKGSGGSVTVEAAQSLTLKAPRVSVQATLSLDLDGGSALSAKGGMVRINS